MTIQACTFEEAPFYVSSPTGSGTIGDTSYSIVEACQSAALLLGETITEITQYTCRFTGSKFAYPVMEGCSTAIADFDPLVGGAFFSFGFAGVMLLYFSSHSIGLVLKAVKNF
jgi:hypothetical protein